MLLIRGVGEVPGGGWGKSEPKRPISTGMLETPTLFSGKAR